MDTLTRYRVIREHVGDRPYATGETRDALPREVAHLVGRVLEELGPVPEEKAEDPPANKAEGAAPANKVSGRKAKSGA